VTTTIVGDAPTLEPPASLLLDLRREREADGAETVTFVFEGAPVAVEGFGASGEPDLAPAGCDQYIDEFEDRWRAAGFAPFWNAWADVSFAEPIAGATPGVVMDEQWSAGGLIVCGFGPGNVVAVPIEGTAADPATDRTEDSVTLRFH
jgi:hypothetical protein